MTGGAGFIGSNLVDALLDRGDEVTVIDNLSTGRHRNLEPAIARHGVELHVEDITDARAVGRIVESVTPEVIYHLAAQIDVRKSIAEPPVDAAVNVLGTINLLEAARAHGQPRFVFSSTGGAIYGEGAHRRLPLDESADCHPDAPYGQSKLAAEGYLDLYRRMFDVPTVALRLGNVYGPRQDPLGEAGVIAIFCGKLLAGEQPTVFGTGRQTRDYIHVADVVAGFIAAGSADVGGAFNLGTGRESSVLDLVEAMGRLGGPGRFEAQMAPARKGEVERIAIDPSAAQATLGWQARIALDEGLAQTFDATKAEQAA
ncbi:MAG: GDP-mannose 4,6-dehydratase [Solirubrobacterales bacterium]